MQLLIAAARREKESHWEDLRDFIYYLQKSNLYYWEETTFIDTATGLPADDSTEDSQEVYSWVPLTESAAKAKLLRGPFLSYLPDSLREDRGIVNAELTEFLAHVASKYPVDYAGPLAGRRAGRREVNGTRILVTESPKLIIPEKGDWSGLGKIFDRMFGPEQIDYFYSWYRRVLQAVLSGNASSLHFFGRRSNCQRSLGFCSTNMPSRQRLPCQTDSASKATATRTLRSICLTFPRTLRFGTLFMTSCSGPQRSKHGGEAPTNWRPNLKRHRKAARCSSRSEADWEMCLPDWRRRIQRSSKRRKIMANASGTSQPRYSHDHQRRLPTQRDTSLNSSVP